MTNRERLIAAMDRKPIDKVPLDFGSTRSGGISALAYNDLLAYKGIDEETYIYDIQQQLAWPGEWLLDQYDVDVVDAGRAFLRDKEAWVPFTHSKNESGWIPAYHKIEKDEEGNIILYTKKGTKVAVKQPSSFYFNQSYWPWQNYEQIPELIKKEDFEEQMWDVPSSPFHLDIINSEEDRKKFSDGLKNFYHETDRAILLDFGIAGFFEAPGYMRGLENWFCDILVDEKGTERILDKYVERCLERLKIILGNAGDNIDVLRLFWDDMGSQENSQLPPETFKKMFAPRYKILTDYIHSNSNCKVLVHSCGSVYRLIPHLIDAGVDMLNPVQTSCKDMEPEKLKKEFGKDLVFWGGGCDTVEVLTKKSPKEIKDHVKERLDVFGADGGFVFVHTHNIQPGVPAENVIAMLEAVSEFR